MRILFIILICMACQQHQGLRVPLQHQAENRTEQGELFTPATQTLNREHHWLKKSTHIDLNFDQEKLQLAFLSPDSKNHMSIKNLPLGLVLPQLYYKTKGDAFDAFNLRLLEYNRVGVGLAYGEGNEGPHFETNLSDSRPFLLADSFRFHPNPHYRPVRLYLVNNCLRPGLFELSASDAAGEIYHGWFNFPLQQYYRQVANRSQLEESFVKDALTYKTTSVSLDLERLRKVKHVFPETVVKTISRPHKYSSQESRKKLNQHFARTSGGGPLLKMDPLSPIIKLAKFEAPGIYRYKKYQTFDYSFLYRPIKAAFKQVTPLTIYQGPLSYRGTLPYYELEIKLENFSLIMGNLYGGFFTDQEDYVIHGFGVGAMPPSQLVERRQLLQEQGPNPAFAYLAKREKHGNQGVNNHEFGLEQIFIRALPQATPPSLLVTVSSYERIIDLVTYQITIPSELQNTFQGLALNYFSPPFNTYRDDNIR